MEINERIKYIMKINNLSPSAFADKIGVSRPTISHILTGRNKASLDLIIKILQSFPNVNSEWLITGNKKINKNIEDSITDKHTNKEITEIIIFFNDGTFKKFLPS